MKLNSVLPLFLQLLNEKNDDDDVESKKQNALLQQLLKEQDKDTKPQLGSLLMESTQVWPFVCLFINFVLPHLFVPISFLFNSRLKKIHY